MKEIDIDLDFNRKLYGSLSPSLPFVYFRMMRAIKIMCEITNKKPTNWVWWKRDWSRLVSNQFVCSFIRLFAHLLRSLSMASGEGQNYELNANIYYGHKFSTCGIAYLLVASELISLFFFTHHHGYTIGRPIPVKSFQYTHNLLFLQIAQKMRFWSIQCTGFPGGNSPLPPLANKIGALVTNREDAVRTK